jgi:hypothetical protein
VPQVCGIRGDEHGPEVLGLWMQGRNISSISCAFTNPCALRKCCDSSCVVDGCSNRKPCVIFSTIVLSHIVSSTLVLNFGIKIIFRKIFVRQYFGWIRSGHNL